MATYLVNHHTVVNCLLYHLHRLRQQRRHQCIQPQQHNLRRKSHDNIYVIHNDVTSLITALNNDEQLID